ncbi:type II secretion system protein J [Chloroflexota bacterium]
MKQRQKGFTLIEIILATGIAGAIVAVVALTTTTLLMNSQQPSVQQILLQQVQNAGYWMPRDIQMSGNVTLSGPNGFPVTINIPVDQDENNNYDVKYLFAGDKMKRQQFDSLDNLTSETLIAQYVDINNTTCDNVTEDLYKLTIRVSLDEETVTASYEMRRRLTTQ